MKKLGFYWSKKEAIKMFLGIVILFVGLLVLRESYIQTKNKRKYEEISLENFRGKVLSSSEVIKVDYPVIIKRDDEFYNSMKDKRSIIFYDSNSEPQVKIIRPDTISEIYIQSEKSYGKTSMFHKYNSVLEDRKIVIYEKIGDGIIFLLVIIGVVILIIGIFTIENHSPIFLRKPK